MPRRASFAVVAIAILAACSSGGDGGDGPDQERARPQPTTTTTFGLFSEAAKNSVLTLDDLPAGWRETEAETENAYEQVSECDGIADDLRGDSEATADASFEQNDAAIENSVAIYGTVADANAVMDTWEMEKVRPCLEGVIAYGAEQDGLSVENVSAGRLSEEQVGDRTVAWQLEFEVESVSAYVDVVLVNVGQSVTQFVFIDVFSPLTNGRSEAIEAVVARLDDPVIINAEDLIPSQ